MPLERAGYTAVVYAIDVSPSMGEEMDDPVLPTPSDDRANGKSRRKTKLHYAKEYVARAMEPKISSGRKTEACGILTFGGKTNNHANRDYVAANPDDDEPMYAHVACDVAIQTAKPRTLEEVMNLEIGEQEGNPVSGLMVALDMLHTHKHTKMWALEVILITDGESSFHQEEYEEAMQRLDDMGVKLSVLGIGFQPMHEAVDKSKTRNKRLAEKFWRTFVRVLYERVSATTAADELLPAIDTFESALIHARLPRAASVNSTVSPINLHIGATHVNEEQAIVIPIRYSKATMKARPPSLSKAWKAAMDLQNPATSASGPSSGLSNQLISSLQQQSQAMDIPLHRSDMAARVSADVKAHSTYVIKRVEGEKATSNEDREAAEDGGMDWDGELQAALEQEAETVAKEDIVKAWRFGSTWVPMEADTFEPLDTVKGVEILVFFPRDAVKRHILMGEVRYIWPDVTSDKAQVQFSSLVQAMKQRDMVAVVRWVLKDKAEPVVGLCSPEINIVDEEKRLDYMYWVKLPFAEDQHNFWFPSLTTYKTTSGKVLKEHHLLPTDTQCDLMDKLVEGLDLDAYAAKEKEAGEQDEDEDDVMLEGDNEAPAWFKTADSYNPAIHRLKEAIFHASLTVDLDADPLEPPHDVLTRYFNTPAELIEGTEKVVSQLKDALKIKKVPPKTRRRQEKADLREGEGYIDIDELFGDSQKNGDAGPKSTGAGVKLEPQSPVGVKSVPPSQSQKPARPKPKHGRLVSNEAPLEDFRRLVEGEGDVFRKAIQDLGAVVHENVESSFSRQAFPLALECLKEMRSTALMYEEVETWNDYLKSLEKTVNADGFKHKDFWSAVEKEGQDISEISPEEAKAALDAYE